MKWTKLFSASVSALLAGIAACTTTTPTNPSPAPGAPAVQPDGADLFEPATFSKWPKASEQPIRVSPEEAFLCAPISGGGNFPQAKHGPHASHSIVVRVSPEAMGAFRAGKAMPAGAVVVKEKYPDERAVGPPKEYGLMIKREAGYDPGNGDWEYAYVTSGAERKVIRGKLAQCSTCHANVKDSDYLFRSYAGYGK